MREGSIVDLIDKWQFATDKKRLKLDFKKLVKVLLKEDGKENLVRLPKSSRRVTSHIFFKSEGVYFCGELLLPEFFKNFCKDKVKFKLTTKDGRKVNKFDPFLIIESSMRDLFVYERPLLNLLMFTCGLTTKTRHFVDKIKVPVLDTRKTLPGLRVLAKYASAIGGAKNHRWNLNDLIMVKDTHRLAYNNDLNLVLKEIKKLKVKKPICVEVENIQDLKTALLHEVDWIMLDNVQDQLDKFFQVIKKASYRPIVEISGNIDVNFKYANSYPFFVSTSQVSYLPEKIDLSLKVI